jgi:hypothetical protein
MFVYVISYPMGIFISCFPPNFFGPVMITLLTLGAD